MPNAFSYLMLLGWPLLGWFIAKRQSVSDSAVVLLILVPYLLLPVSASIDLPGLPPLDKVSVPSLTVLAILSRRYKKFAFFPDSGGEKLLMLLLLVFPLFTFINNVDAYSTGGRYMVGLSIMDVFSMVFANATLVLIPVMAGYLYLNTSEAHRRMLIIVLLAGLAYSLLILWEVRMSPRLHHQIYGFFPHSWKQQIREGGFRPVVFLGHGLRVAVFFAMVTIAGLVLRKARDYPMRHWGLIKCLYLVAVLVLCKTWSALIYAALALAVIVLLGARGWVKVAKILAVIVILFPLLRGADLVPTADIADFIAEYNEARAGSLAFRFYHEDLLLEKAREKPWFGWGGWGRSRVFDPETGQDLSVTDGEWIIRYGTYGWFGYLVPFGLLTLSLWKLAALYKQKTYRNPSPYTAGLALILAFSMLDQLPNSSINPLMFLVAGAILGLVNREAQLCQAAQGVAGGGRLNSKPRRRAFSRQSNSAAR